MLSNGVKLKLFLATLAALGVVVSAQPVPDPPDQPKTFEIRLPTQARPKTYLAWTAKGPSDYVVSVSTNLIDWVPVTGENTAAVTPILIDVWPESKFGPVPEPPILFATFAFKTTPLSIPYPLPSLITMDKGQTNTELLGFVAGSNPIKQQWYKGGQPLFRATNNFIRYAEAGEYYFIARNPWSSVTSSVTVVQLPPFPAPVILRP